MMMKTDRKNLMPTKTIYSLERFGSAWLFHVAPSHITRWDMSQINIAEIILEEVKGVLLNEADELPPYHKLTITVEVEREY